MSRRRLILGGLLAAVGFAACHEPTGTASVLFDGLLDKRLPLTLGRPTAVGVSRGGQVVVALSDTTFVARFAVTADTIVRFSPVGMDPTDISFTSSGGTAYVTFARDPAVYTVDMATGRSSGPVDVGVRNNRILMLPDNSGYYLLGEDSVVRLVARDSNLRFTSSFVLFGRLRAISRRTQDGRLAVSAGSWIHLFTALLLQYHNGDFGFNVEDLAHSLDGSVLFASLPDRNQVLVLDATTLAVTDSIRFPGDAIRPFALQLSKDGATLLVTSPISGRVAVVDVATRTVRRVLVTGGVPKRIAFSPDGRRAFITNEAGWVDVLR